MFHQINYFLQWKYIHRCSMKIPVSTQMRNLLKFSGILFCLWNLLIWYWNKIGFVHENSKWLKLMQPFYGANFRNYFLLTIYPRQYRCSYTKYIEMFKEFIIMIAMKVSSVQPKIRFIGNLDMQHILPISNSLGNNGIERFIHFSNIFKATKQYVFCSLLVIWNTPFNYRK